MERDERGDEQPTEPIERASREEVARRVALVRKLIQQGKQAGEIKRAASKEFGIRPRVVEKYIAKAREQIRRDLALSKSELQCESLEFYRGIVSDPKHPIQARLRAREQMDRILGLNAGFQLHITETPKAESVNRQEMYERPHYLDYLRDVAKKEDAKELADGDDADEGGTDGDTGIVWEDGDEGSGESGAVA